jgi:RNA polymerase sigma-70 factor (ECF subfamily)
MVRTTVRVGTGEPTTAPVTTDLGLRVERGFEHREDRDRPRVAERASFGPRVGGHRNGARTIDQYRAAARSDAEPGDRESVDDQARRAVAAVLAGDRDAFRVLIDRESSGVLRICRRVLGDVNEAEDVAQEAFIAAYRSLATWRGDGPFGAWMARIAVRLAVRRAAVRRTTVRWVSPDPAAGSDGAGVERGSGDDARELDAMTTSAGGARSNDPAVIVLASERHSAIRRAISRLPDPYREVVALRFFAELSLAEIAIERGAPLGTVKTHLRRGLVRLRDAFDKDGFGR